MRIVTFFGAAIALAVSGTACAQDMEDAPAIEVSASITAISDYSFRGISLSDRDPAVQASLEAEHRSGVYVGAWGSSIARYADTNAELDVYGGWRGTVGGLDLDLGAQAYLYPGGKGGNYAELIGSVSKTLGPAELQLGAAWSPAQKNIGNADNRYFFAGLSSGIPGTPLTISANLGHEKGSLGGPRGKKWDWGLGAEAVLGRFRLGISWVDSNIKRVDDPDGLADSAIIGSASIDF